MHTRQSGAAHVNIFFFLVMLVLFLGALGFAYITLEKNKQLEQRVQTAEQSVETSTLDALADKNANLLVYKHYVEDLAKVVGELGEYAGREGYSYVDSADDPVTPTAIAAATLPSRVRAAIRDFAQQIKVPESDGLSTFFGHVKNAVDSAENANRDLETARADLASQVAKLQDTVSETSSSHARQVAALNAQLTQKTEEHQAAIDEKDNTIRTANAQYTRAREDKSAAAEDAARIQLQLRKEKNNLTAQLDAAVEKTRLINPASAPDGAIIDASQATGLAWINRGRKDMLPTGITFVIVAPGKDGVKAYGTVQRVEDSRAELRITGLKDEYDPVVQGDLIRNDLYSPELRHNIYLMGRFSQPYTRPIVKAMLERLGNNVVEKLGPGVDLILLGADTINEDGSGFTPLTESQDYKDAQFLRIEMAPLQKVREFLRLADS